MSSRKKRTASNRNFMNNIMDDVYHPEEPICQIIATNTKTPQNVFTKYRPGPGRCDDYNISQTEIKMDAGNTKIHVQQTNAEYIPFLAEAPPPPPRSKRCKYYSGGPPQWEFLHEIFHRDMEAKQERYRREFADRVAWRKKTEREGVLQKHRQVMSLSGPIWYQELSPKQIEVIDTLRSSIFKDYTDGVICHTQNCMAKLGLVLRPSQKHLRKALENCCKCPVEFLLILYQLMNPKRKKYSINDRLLLSSVVHLAMRDTLRELHVRIPSPPPPPKVTKATLKKKPRVKYVSPYLQPFAMERDPPKHSGVYYNKHLQRPQSPYFSYLEDFETIYYSEESDVEIKPRSKKSRDEEIDKETEVAQQFYEQLVDFRPVPRLLKPSRYKQCYNFRNKFELPFGLIEKIPNIDDEVITCSCNRDKKAKRKIKKKLARFKEDVPIVGGVVERPEGPVMIITGLQPKTEPEVCTCADDFAYLQKRKELIAATAENEQKFIVGGVVKTADGPVLAVSGVQPEHPTEEELAAQREELVRSMVEQKKKFVIEGVVNRPDGPVFLISRVQPGFKCEEEDEDVVSTEEVFASSPQKFCPGDCKLSCAQYSEEESKEEEEDEVTKPCRCVERRTIEQEAQERARKAADDQKKVVKGDVEEEICDCKGESRKIIDTPLCNCERCQQDRRNKTTMLVIQGMKETDDEKVIPVIDAVISEQPCKCLEKYEQKIAAYESYQERKQLVLSTLEQKDKFVVGGVVNTPQGPVFVHQGLQPELDCGCREQARQQAAFRHHQMMMPHPPPGRIQYGISGVKETPEGNVYILNNAVPIEDCDCMKVYDAFREKHGACLRMYEAHMNQMKNNIDELVQEFNGSIHEPCTHSELEQVFPEQSKLEEKEEMVVAKCPRKLDEESVQLEKKICDVSCCPPALPPVEPKEECESCTCGANLGNEEEEEEDEESSEDEEIEQQNNLKRFFIFKKIQCGRKWQMDVVKKALKSMADDGYPLAKLPQCEKLPHFKLWMQMRCGKFWTQEQKYKSVLISKCWWRHVDSCTVRTIRHPKMKIDKTEAALLDWSKASYVRKLANDAQNSYYRRVRKVAVDIGREFFPTTFEYQFPFHTFRDCYYAYTPAKEEDILAMFVWQKYEYNNMADRRHCSC